jgi:acylphosphatase
VVVSRCIRCLVSGRVQGVWFRGSTRQQAVALGLGGHARNLADGRVEVVACGETAALEPLKAWLRQGPPTARVDGVECTEIDLPPPESFTTG